MTSIDSAARAETVPPKILDLVWTPDPERPGTFLAGHAEDFGYAEFYVRQDMRAPICLEETAMGYRFVMATYVPEYVSKWIAELEQKITNRTLREKAERKFYHDVVGSDHRDAVTAAVETAQALYAEYGAACRDLTAMLRLIELRYLSTSELKKLQKINAKSRATIADMPAIAAKIEQTPYPFPLDDDFVVAGIKRLTELDQDHNAFKNLKGWGRQTTAPGHWCYAMLSSDRAKAIEVGRVLVSQHIPQLRREGIVPAAVKAKRAA